MGRQYTSSDNADSIKQPTPAASTAGAAAATACFYHAGSPRRPAQVLTLPTALTLVRVAAVPVLIAVWYSRWVHAAPACAALFVVAALTDFLDGYLARLMGTVSAFGAFLDPVADKLMVATVLILISTHPIASGSLAGNDWLLPTLSTAIIGREITMSALREWAAALGGEAHQAVAVSSLGKWKTATQMASLTLLLAVSDGGSGAWISAVTTTGTALLSTAAGLTVWSLMLYMIALWPYLSRTEQEL